MTEFDTSQLFLSKRLGEVRIDPCCFFHVDDDLPDDFYQAPQETFPDMLTFDDGARDVVTWALPLLEKHNATASIFVCAQPYRAGRARDGDDPLRHRAASALEPALG